MQMKRMVQTLVVVLHPLGEFIGDLRYLHHSLLAWLHTVDFIVQVGRPIGGCQTHQTGQTLHIIITVSNSRD